MEKRISNYFARKELDCGIDVVKFPKRAKNVYIEQPQSFVSRQERESAVRHRSIALWFTGLSGSGKSTIAHALEERLHGRGIRAYVFDGDRIRHGLCSDLGFDSTDRSENIRRVAEVTRLFIDAGVVCLCAFVSPMRVDRERARQIVGCSDFHEIYVRCPLEECERRDVKGYYQLARLGTIKNYTGISSPYEPPLRPDAILDTDTMSLPACLDKLEAYLFDVCKLDCV